VPVLVQDPDLGVLGEGEGAQGRAGDHPAENGIVGDAGLGGERAGGAAELLAEVATDPVTDHLAEDEREADQDHQGQPGSGDRDSPADGDPLEEGDAAGVEPPHAAAFST